MFCLYRNNQKNNQNSLSIFRYFSGNLGFSQFVLVCFGSNQKIFLVRFEDTLVSVLQTIGSKHQFLSYGPLVNMHQFLSFSPLGSIHQFLSYGTWGNRTLT
jgi:hypothetical protein